MCLVREVDSDTSPGVSGLYEGTSIKLRRERAFYHAMLELIS